MDLSFSSLFCGFFFGVIGAWMIRNGKKAGNALHVFVGIALIAYPYFIENVFLNWGLGFTLCGVAWIYRRF